MWNPNSGAAADESRKDVSVSDKKLTQSSGSASSDPSPQSQQGTLVPSEEKLIEQEGQSCDVDSGFISGPQLSGYEDSDYSLEDAPKGSQHSQDSQERPALRKQQTVIEAASTNIDSGLDLNAEDSEPAEGMILDRNSKLDSGLVEWFCNLSLKNSNQLLNNLGCPDIPTTTSSATAANKYTQNIPGSGNRLPWGIYYAQNDVGDTQLHIASIFGRQDIVAALIRLAPADAHLFDVQNDMAQTSMHLAVITGNHEIVRMLLIAGARATVRDLQGNTPLHLACISGNMDCVRALTAPLTATEIDEGMKNMLLTKDERSLLRQIRQLPPQLETRNYDGERYVHLAAKHNHIDVLRHLVSLGADINAREGLSGKTPLHIAIESCNEALANFLLVECNKLNLEIETFAGLTAYQVAAANQLEQFANKLQRHGAEELRPPASDDESDDESDYQSYAQFSNPNCTFINQWKGNHKCCV